MKLPNSENFTEKVLDQDHWQVVFRAIIISQREQVKLKFFLEHFCQITSHYLYNSRISFLGPLLKRDKCTRKLKNFLSPAHSHEQCISCQRISAGKVLTATVEALPGALGCSVFPGYHSRQFHLKVSVPGFLCWLIYKLDVFSSCFISSVSISALGTSNFCKRIKWTLGLEIDFSSHTQSFYGRGISYM